MSWLWHFLGFDFGLPYGHVGPYNVWSGFGSDVGQVTLIGAIIAALRHKNCHTKGCWRLGKHTVDGTPWCSKHHQQARANVADAQGSAGPGSNPGQSTGLNADQPSTAEPPLGSERMVPPAATHKGT